MTALWHALIAWMAGNAFLVVFIWGEAALRRRRRARGAQVIEFPRPIAPVIPLRPAVRR
ncbi:MAG TPA: hypothetical protein VFH54_12655 [Mycobacteriales bacterium]|nr:hypothetical protein [Mycobacteriales bacterium]